MLIISYVLHKCNTFCKKYCGAPFDAPQTTAK